jgi:hypothetical protein
MNLRSISTAVAAAAVLAACGSSALPTVTDGAAPTADASPDGARPVWSSEATKLVAEQKGFGFGPPMPPQCAIAARYTFTVGDRQLLWAACKPQAGGDWKFSEGTRILNDAQWEGVAEALARVVLTRHPDGCGADKPDRTLAITTPAGEARYLDSFYACDKAGNYVDYIDGVFDAFAPLAF